MLFLSVLPRRCAVGAISGAAASAALMFTFGHGAWSVVLGAIIGAAYSAAIHPTRSGWEDSLMSGGSLGVPLWGLISVIAVPLLSGQMPEWNAEQMRQHFPALMGWVMYGALLGVIQNVSSNFAVRFFGAQPADEARTISVTTRIVILGGGFAEALRQAAVSRSGFAKAGRRNG